MFKSNTRLNFYALFFYSNVVGDNNNNELCLDFQGDKFLFSERKETLLLLCLTENLKAIIIIGMRLDIKIEFGLVWFV